MEKKKSTRRQIERSSEPMYRKYRASFLNQGEGVTSLKKCRSSEKFEGLQEHSPSRVRFNFDKSFESPKTVGRKTFKMPKGILKFTKIESSEVNEADERSPYDYNNIHVYELTTRGSSNFSSEKEIPQVEKSYSFGNIFGTALDPFPLRDTAQFGLKDN